MMTFALPPCEYAFSAQTTDAVSMYIMQTQRAIDKALYFHFALAKTLVSYLACSDGRKRTFGV